jgi:ApaG protein
MFSKITSGIKITVKSEYDSKNSFPSENRFVFRYHIGILNLGNIPIQVLKRKWLIYDVGFGFTEVVGDGVIGLTPELQPMESFNYFSNVQLRSGVGNMSGKYLVKNLLNDETFEVEIPKFSLMSEVLSN